MPCRFGAIARPNSAPLPGGLPERSRNRLATCLPLSGSVSTIRPFPPLTVSTSRLLATARPSGAFRKRPEVMTRPVPAGVVHEQVAIVPDPESRRRDHERGRVGPLGEAGPDLRYPQQAGQLAWPEAKTEPEHGAPVDGLAVRSNRAVKHVRNEQ